MHTASIAPGAVRDITAAEAEHYQANGWVKLEKLVQRGVVDELLARMKAQMGAEAEKDFSGGYNVKTPRPPQAKTIFTTYEDPAKDDDFARAFAFSPGIGRVLTKCAGGPVRHRANNCYVKMPVGRAGGKTPWHQDWPYYPFDRAGSLTVWIALVDIPPEMGTMRFVTGSHLWGPQGRVIGRTDGKDTLDILPGYLRSQVQVSPPLDMKAGDATVHNDLTIHSAPPNETEQLRWVFTVCGFPADTLYTGCPQRRTDDLGLELNQPLEHPNFPVLST